MITKPGGHTREPVFCGVMTRLPGAVRAHAVQVPLASHGRDLTDAELARYARHFPIPGFGVDGQRRLANARVLVVGAGGLGSPVLLYLAAAGVGTIGIVDDDVVDTTNLQRQVIHGVSGVGQPKADSAARAIAGLNPHVTAVPHRLRLTSENALDLLRDYDIVCDGCDNFPTRYLVSDAAEILGKPVVWGSILQCSGQVSVFWAPGVTLRDVFPAPPPPGAVPDATIAGVLGATVATIGSVMAAEVVKLITGAGTPLLGRLVVFDSLAMTWSEISVCRDPHRPAVRALAGSAGPA
jgi:adenylyltransferase/sulfurtransferase